MNALFETNFKFPNQTAFYRGKVRDVYTINNKYLVIIATDRISAFDVVLPKPIPFKGQVLNQIATHFLEKSKDIVPNWLISSPHPYVAIGHLCEPYKVEMVIRAYLTGHAWRFYDNGFRRLCGVILPDGLRENQKFFSPIITPTTKASEGHDEGISRGEIILKEIVDGYEYFKLEDYTRMLFEFGTDQAIKNDLLLVDTKYEFGKDLNGNIRLIDEIHTPDSSRYFYAASYDKLFRDNKKQKQLSKEFVREWLMENGFMGEEGQQIPEMPDSFVESVTQRYIELYEKIINKQFVPVSHANLEKDIYDAALKGLEALP